MHMLDGIDLAAEIVVLWQGDIEDGTARGSIQAQRLRIRVSLLRRKA